MVEMGSWNLRSEVEGEDCIEFENGWGGKHIEFWGIYYKKKRKKRKPYALSLFSFLPLLWTTTTDSPPPNQIFSLSLSPSISLFLPLSLSLDRAQARRRWARAAALSARVARAMGGTRRQARARGVRWRGRPLPAAPAACGGRRRRGRPPPVAWRKGNTPFSSMLSHPLYFPLLPWHRQQNRDATTSKRRNSKVREFLIHSWFNLVHL